MRSNESDNPDAAPEERSADAPVPQRPTDKPEQRPERPVLPTISRDETDVGWGDEPSQRDAEWYRRERPPHHE